MPEYFSLRALLYQVDVPARIEISLSEPLQQPGWEFSLVYYNESRRNHAGEGPTAETVYDWPLQRQSEDCLTLDFCPYCEGEHTLAITAKKGDQCLNTMLNVYSLPADWFALNPYKGNLHCHTTASDGDLSPEVLAAKSRAAGFDFLAITDHHYWQPPLADPLFSAAGMTFISGEEVHPLEGGAIHLLSLGAPESVSAWQHDHEQEYRQQVTERLHTYDGYPDHERLQAAICDVLLDRIREVGGLSVYCHPYWRCFAGRSHYNATPLLNELVFKSSRFEALELGNCETYRTALMNARYCELCRDGFQKPLIGASDYHGHFEDEFLSSVYTVVLAPECSQEAVCQAIRQEYCAAVAGTVDVMPFGPFRLLKYVIFLLKYFFPRHDRLCQQQGELLLRALQGEENLDLEIQRLKQEITAWQKALKYSPEGR